MFWASLGIIVYTYLGYPLVLKILSYFFSVPVNKAAFNPLVTLITSVYNEEKVVAAKIENSLTLDYPKDHLEIMVVSDASTDRTEEISREYACQGVKTLRIEGRVGKTACLNKAIADAKGEIIIFSDANSIYDKGAVREIVANFADNRVGCVTGYTRYISQGASTMVESVGLYAHLEKKTKELESMLGSCVGADGAIFAIRKELYRPLKVTDINDFVIPLQVVSQSYRSILEAGAYCYEETAKDSQGEFNRQVRITNRTLRAMFNNKELFNVFRYKLFSFHLISHKLLKFMVPLFMAVMFLSNLILAGRSLLFKVFLLLQAIFYGAAMLKMKEESGPLLKLISACRAFVIVNAAILKGWITYCRGEDFTIWKSSR
jgi:cellulose synthase/poly-beta-1,6-N-acetylglucosamine synthase-like glycosyltransferase